MGPKKRLSARAYAQSRRERNLSGGTHPAVLKAVATGRLAGAVERKGRRILIDGAAADLAWERNTNQTEAAKSVDPDAPAAKATKKKGRAKKPNRTRHKATQKSNADAPEEPVQPGPKPRHGDELVPEEVPEIRFPHEPGANGETGSLFGAGSLPPEPGEVEQAATGERATMAQANASRVAWQAQTARLDFQEREGLLVKAAVVEAETYRIFRILRDRILSIHGRIDANLAAETDRAACREMLAQEHELALNSVANLVGAEGERTAEAG